MKPGINDSGGKNMNLSADWIMPKEKMGEIVPMFERTFTFEKEVQKATLSITAMGVYAAALNGQRVGEFIMAPGFTAYDKRLQLQSYDVTKMLQTENTLSVLVGRGWYRSMMAGWAAAPVQKKRIDLPAALIAELDVKFTDGTKLLIPTDTSWTTRESMIRESSIYDGEVADATVRDTEKTPAVLYDGPTDTIIAQEGSIVKEMQTLIPARAFRTPKGELVIDFGQNLTGYVETSVFAKAGEEVDLSFAEVMDKEGNFYTENYRAAKCKYHYTCCDGQQTYKPQLTFWGFRYIRVNEFPGGVNENCIDAFRAIALHSEMKRTGYLRCSNAELNQFFDNVIWGQCDNFLDVPTDCPQRDERLGWTGDAQVFCSTACKNFDAEQFFTKWLADLAAEQHDDGFVGVVIPDCIGVEPSAAWGDAATICPWEVYLAYGNPEILRRQYHSMCSWVHYIDAHSTTKDLWTGGTHFGDWLGLDAPSGSYKGSTRDDFIASAYFAYSTSLVIKAGKVLGEDVSEFEALYARIVKAFRAAFPTCRTQTECVLAVHFGLAEDLQKTADQLAGMIREAGVQMKTGFVGTPYLLPVLSRCGYADIAYSLLLRREYPSWLYSVTKGATTVWEHWDGVMPNGDFWSADMNSFNHYAYGSVMDWVYAFCAGIRTEETAPGYEKAILAPHPDQRLDWLEAGLDTRRGKITSRWKKQEGMWRFDITTPVESRIIIGSREYDLPAGSYVFFDTL
jgi:alpha-L-rhamnosidase